MHWIGTATDIDALKKLQQQKDDFISIASHELKTPITSLNASLQLLDRVKDNPSSKVLPPMISQARKSMQKISKLVDDLLNVGRIQKGQLPLNKTTFTISKLLNACCNPIILAGKHKFHIICDKELKVYADEHRIDQVMTNLINNAVKYAPNSTDISLIIQKEQNVVKVSVKDSGPGIPKDKLPHLFDRYYRVNSTGYQTSGLGLGLYISSEIIKRHGGEIGVESELGKGSTFWFTLPLHQ
jgi:signal transduction histidine kinase